MVYSTAESDHKLFDILYFVILRYLHAPRTYVAVVLQAQLTVVIFYTHVDQMQMSRVWKLKLEIFFISEV